MNGPDERIGDIRSAADYVKDRTGVIPQVAIVAGSGLGEHLSSIVTITHQIPYSEVPGFPLSTVVGHKGMLIAGKVAHKPVLLLCGRKHVYEGESLFSVVFPSMMLSSLDVPRLILTNAAGGLNPGFLVGDLMLITEGVNFMFRPFLFNEFYPAARMARLDSSAVFSPVWRQKVLAVAKRNGVFIRSGVYIAGTGPSYETPSEVRFLRDSGGDAIGMSTVPEATMAAALGIEVIGISFITNLLSDIPLRKTSHEEVIAASRESGPRLAELIGLIIKGT